MFLTRDQLIELTGYKRAPEQRRELSRMGIRHWVRIDGKPVVDDSALSQPPSEGVSTPNWGALDGLTKGTA